MLGIVGLSAVSMAGIIAAGLSLALAVYLLVVRPWQLEPVAPEAVLVAAH